MDDRDTRAVMARLDQALTTSGLSLRVFAHALGTSPSRFSAYRTGRTAPSAAFLLRAERIADALARARASRVPSSIDAVGSVRAAARGEDDDWTYALALEVRGRLRDVLARHRDVADAWEAKPPDLEARWATLVAAFVAKEFDDAGLCAPDWTATPRLDVAWVLDTPRLSSAQVRSQTPDWLAERNIYIATKDLVTV